MEMITFPFSYDLDFLTWGLSCELRAWSFTYHGY
uniref:Uncharacterized protein n=1 Tax=Rhizophora mucronata TaxID=61149 RepID=A0A2P2NQR6_RHIMU